MEGQGNSYDLGSMVLVLRNTLCYEAQACVFLEACFPLGAIGGTLCEALSIRAIGQNKGASFGEQFVFPVDDDDKNYPSRPS
jgi:hypothetical protein